MGLLAQEYGMPRDCYILATPSKRYQSVYAYNGNLLRSTTACMSAILGGADFIMNRSYDAAYKRVNSFSSVWP